MFRRGFFTTGGIGYYLILGALAYTVLRGRSALGATPIDPTTGLPITRTAESGPVYTSSPSVTLLPIRMSGQAGGFI